LKKTREEKTRCNPVKNPVATTFVFFLLLKQRRFDFKKKHERPGQNLDLEPSQEL
jgi:hypothetical protein